jgi:TPR repeat protein
MTVLVAPARADFWSGVEAYNRGDYAAALAAWKPLAEKGHGDAQNNLAILYDEGHGVAESPAEALRWYRAAAKAGRADAQNNLGYLHETGRGVDEDLVEAFKWYNIAIANGNDTARRNSERIAGRLSGDELARAREMARGWLLTNRPE